MHKPIFAVIPDKGDAIKLYNKLCNCHPWMKDSPSHPVIIRAKEGLEKASDFYDLMGIQDEDLIKEAMMALNDFNLLALTKLN